MKNIEEPFNQLVPFNEDKDAEAFLEELTEQNRQEYHRVRGVENGTSLKNITG
jgi:hypothetical protein